jgi:hypothetical protein
LDPKHYSRDNVGKKDGKCLYRKAFHWGRSSTLLVEKNEIADDIALYKQLKLTF